MKILTLDIETSPNLAHVWGLFKQNVGLNQLIEPTEVMCFAAKWHGQKEKLFFSNFHHDHKTMVQQAYNLLSEADVVVHYNGTSFDIPHLMREFYLEGMTPPAPFKQVDLFRQMKKLFRFSSHKLDHIASESGIGSKVKHAGHSLWVRCMAGEESAWEEMKSYNIGDVVLTEELFDNVRPWLTLPNMGLYDPSLTEVCPNCGGTDLEKRGFRHTLTSSYQRYRCNDCGSWPHSGKSERTVDLRASA